MKKILIVFLCLVSYNSFSQNFGCTDSLALNYDSLATDDDGSCLYCSSLANFNVDTVSACDSIQISVINIQEATYNWNSSNIYSGQDAQYLLDIGYSPYQVFSLITSPLNNGSISSLYECDFQGGYLFYLDTLSKEGLIAAFFDEPQTTWGFGCMVGNSNGVSTSDSLFTGQMNTNLILSGSGLSCSDPSIAAAVCDNSIQSGYDDWFLPSSFEVNIMYDNLFNTPNFDFTNDFYWSSTEDPLSLHIDVKGRNFINGLIQTMPKDHVHSVRPVRKFLNSGSSSFSVLNPGWNSVTMEWLGCVSTDSIYVNLYCYGCTDPNATNYDPIATVDDGSCTYMSCSNPAPTGLTVDWVTDIKAGISWDNMNDSSCMVWKYYVRYREVGTPNWTTKSAGVGNGLCNFGLNTTTKTLQLFSINNTYGTTYEFKMKAFYCGGTESNYSAPIQFTTKPDCPPMTNLTATTFSGNQAKVRFDWDTTGVNYGWSSGAYVFARVALRVDTAGANWQTAGGFGVYYPTLQVNKFGLQPGESYRAQGRTFCDSNITSYRSWWTSPIFWTQPGSIRLNGGTSINNLDVYPNPTDDIFNVSFVSEEIQALSIRVLNIVGEVIYEESLEQFVGEYTKQISLGDYSKGMHFLEIYYNDYMLNKKLILH